MAEKPQGELAEEWVKKFAISNRILSKQDYPLEQLVISFNDKLQLRLHSARLHIDKFFPFANEWLDLILAGKSLPERSSQQTKIELVQKLLDLVLATDLIVELKDSRGRKCAIAIDVTADPQKEQEKLNTIGGRRKDHDPTKFNRNRNIPEIRESLGIDKHLVLVLNPNYPPSYEQLLAELHGFANVSTRTRSINLWSSTNDIPRTSQQPQSSALKPQELWRRYNQGITTSSDVQRQVAIAEKACQEGLQAKLPDILACDPFVQKIQREQGGQKARQHIQVIIRAVSIKFEASEQPSPSPKQQRRDAEL